MTVKYYFRIEPFFWGLEEKKKYYNRTGLYPGTVYKMYEAKDDTPGSRPVFANSNYIVYETTKEEYLLNHDRCEKEKEEWDKDLEYTSKW